MSIFTMVAVFEVDGSPFLAAELHVCLLSQSVDRLPVEILNGSWDDRKF